MGAKKLVVAYEFSTLYVEGEAHKEGEIPLPEVSFNNLWEFILSNKLEREAEPVMSANLRGRRRFIRTGRFVGTVETKDGQVIEVLPKVYRASGRQEADQDVCRRIFLNMLRHFTHSEPKSLGQAGLETLKGFPILEVYVGYYLDEVERLVSKGLRKGYSVAHENQKFLKGRLDFQEQVTKNAVNKARFAISYNKYLENIPRNRVIATTLRKLLLSTGSVANRERLSKLLLRLQEIPSCEDIERDLQIASGSNRLFASYDMVLKWSRQFLLNRGFTVFSGNSVNQALLFQAEKLFENFIAHLFRKYAPSYKVEAQNCRYFLVDRHNGRGTFRLRPDIVMEAAKAQRPECIIIDTKWKAIDSGKADSNYLIDIKDMYQLYAYGQKYREGESDFAGTEIVPKLALIYPYSERFTKALPEFVYEEIRERYGLRLMVVPFDLTKPSTYGSQVHGIIDSLRVEPEEQPVFSFVYEAESPLAMVSEKPPVYSAARQMLVGCYNSREQLCWILSKKLYNARIQENRPRSSMVVNASRLLLYDCENQGNYKVFVLDPSRQIFADRELMKAYGYPKLTEGREYILYIIGREITRYPEYDVPRLKREYGFAEEDFAPFFVRL